MTREIKAAPAGRLASKQGYRIHNALRISLRLKIAASALAVMAACVWTPLFAQEAAPQSLPNAIATAGPAANPSARIPQSTRHSVSPLNTYHRVICVVPYVGQGTREDPRRPKYAPVSSLGNPHLTPAVAPSRAGIIAYKQIPTDDNQFAIVEFVAVNHAAFASILADTSILTFEKDKHARVEIETALKKLKKEFVLESLGAITQ